MFNLIKMDLHRLIHSIAFWVMLVTIAALSIFATSMTDMEQEMIIEQDTAQIEYSAEDAESISLGIFVTTDPGWATGDIPFSDLIAAFWASRIMLIVCVIFIPMFVNGENKSGYIKNIAGQLSNKGMLVISKLVIAAMQVFIILACFSLFTAIFSAFLWGERLVIGSLTDLLAIFGLQYLLHFSLTSVALMLTILFKNSGISMTWGILCSTGTTAILYRFVSVFLHSFEGLHAFVIEKYTIETNISSITSGLEQDTLTRIVIVGIIYVILATVGSVMVMQKRDI